MPDKLQPRLRRTINSATKREEMDASPCVAATSDLWREYRANPAPNNMAVRQALLQKHLDLIRFVAVKLAARLPGCVDMNDLIQEGYFGLDRAIDVFDPTRGVQFSTFAAKRIWGAMMDGLRSADWQRRTDRRRTQRIEAARLELACESGRSPTEAEVAGKLGISTREYAELWEDSRTKSIKSLWGGGPKDANAGRSAREQLPIDERSEDPSMAVQREDIKELLVRGFTRSERLIVMLYYYEDMTMKEIGRTLDISESRVSQMHSLLVQRIRAVINEWELE